MQSKIIRVRLKPHELEMLSQILSSEERGKMNQSEMIRLLIHREFLRRTTGKSKVLGNAVSSDMRVGRPRGVE
jgi:hypothetical protein